MAALKQIDPSIELLAARNHSAVLRAADTVMQKNAATLLGISAPALSAWSTEHLARSCQVLAAYGLKVIPQAEKTYSVAEIAAYKTLARLQLAEDDAAQIGGAK
jgi:hypothetical protein